MKKTIYYILVLFVLIVGYFAYINSSKILPLYMQLTQDRVGVAVDLQSPVQKEAHFAGAAKCAKCHKDNHAAWKNSRHPRMIQEPKKDPSVVVADFSRLPEDADFALEDAVFTVGGKFKQRYMIRKDSNNSEDYVLGNYQWNVQTMKW